MKETIYNWRFHALIWLFLTPIIAGWSAAAAGMDEQAERLSADSEQLSADIEALQERVIRLGDGQ